MQHLTHKELTRHIIYCLAVAESESSKLTPEILSIEGMSSSRIRHFLNNLCTRPNTRYLEIGCWQGSTLISALFNNNIEAIAIDNWSEFSGSRTAFFENIQRFTPNQRLRFFEGDCFQINKPEIFTSRINLYFYGGHHSESSQEQAFCYFNDIFDDIFIAIIDDWNDEKVRNGTRSAFKKLNYTTCFECQLFTPCNGHVASWWNGLCVSVLKKSQTP
ncbi:MAG: hypothetical protein HW387_1012 [Parachlamydiales bacterium]|nr:hypothetical protein [Parachlamydiales bacterium]